MLFAYVRLVQNAGNRGSGKACIFFLLEYTSCAERNRDLPPQASLPRDTGDVLCPHSSLSGYEDSSLQSCSIAGCLLSDLFRKFLS